MFSVTFVCFQRVTRHCNHRCENLNSYIVSETYAWRHNSGAARHFRLSLNPREGTEELVSTTAIPVTGCGGLQGCGMLRIPHCLGSRLTDGGKVVSLTHRPRSTPRNIILLLLVLVSVTG
jgi:hypothetical protein